MAKEYQMSLVVYKTADENDEIQFSKVYSQGGVTVTAHVSGEVLARMKTVSKHALGSEQFLLTVLQPSRF